MKESLKITGASILAAILYGIAQDMVTVRVSLEYFTAGHPNVFNTANPTVLALGWGVIASWWAGLILGLCLSVAAQYGPRVRLRLVDIAAPACMLIVIVGTCTAVAGELAFRYLGSCVRSPLFLSADEAFAWSDNQCARFAAAACAHTVTYLTACVGGLVLCVRTWRIRPAKISRSEKQDNIMSKEIP